MPTKEFIIYTLFRYNKNEIKQQKRICTVAQILDIKQINLLEYF